MTKRQKVHLEVELNRPFFMVATDYDHDDCYVKYQYYHMIDH
jgi:hypothetical protein